MLIRGIECLRKLGGHVVERARASVNRRVNGITGGLERFLGIIDAALGVLHQLLGRLVDRTRLLEHTARRRQRIGRRAQNARERRRARLNVLQVLDRIAQRRGQIGDKVAHLVGAHVIEQAGHRLKADGRDGLGKGLVDLALDGARALLGHDLCDGVGLLVLIELDIGVLHVGREERHHVCAKTFRDNNGSVVRARLNALNRLITVVEDDPIEVLVAAQGGGYVFAHVDLDGNQIALVALIGVDHCNLKVAGIAVGIPASGDVKPRVQAWHDDQAHHNNQADHGARHVLDIALKQVQDVFHLCLTSFRVLAKRGGVPVVSAYVVNVVGILSLTMRTDMRQTARGLFAVLGAPLAGVETKHATGSRDGGRVLAHLTAKVLVRKRRDTHLGIEARC